MRKIKFRQWTNNSKMKWHYFEFKEGAVEGVMSASLKENPIMQYTGLKDKNGKEIYERDILKYDDLFGDKETGYIDFQNGTFIMKSCNHREIKMWKDGVNDWYSIENLRYEEKEIIGNIHENPELLK